MRTDLTIIISLLMFSLSLKAQEQRILGPDDVQAIVLQHHPMALQADLLRDRGEATVQQARGGFDPKIGSDVGQKYFKGQQYYSLIDAGLKVPTWFGIELNAGYEQNAGTFLNPENSTSGGGLIYAGISLPVGRGLFMDERRAQLRKAQVYKNSTEVERRLMLNKLLLDAGKAYWDWFQAFQTKNVYAEALELAEFRYNAVVNEVAAGDRAAIDTVEAAIQVQNRQMALQQAELELRNSKAQLEVYLWESGQAPLELEDDVQPVTMAQVLILAEKTPNLDRLDSLISDHPYLQKFRFYIDRLKIDRRLKVEQLKPQLDLKYNALNQPVGNELLAGLSINNYTWGLQFSLPIPLRKERGALRLADLNIRDAELEVANQRAMIGQQIEVALNTWQTTFEQAQVSARNVADYARLLQGERDKFEAGESSLFMVNSREMGFVQAQVKYMEVLSKNRKAEIQTVYSVGALVE